MSNFIKKFFWSCAGADIEVLEECHSDQTKYLSIGIIIFLVACFAGIAMFFAASTIVENPLIAAGIGFLWSIMILMLDRLIVATIRNDEFTTGREKLIAAIPRVTLAIIIAVVISRPIEVKIFEEEILAQVLKDRENDTQKFSNKVKGNSSISYLNNQDTTLNLRINELDQQINIVDIPTSTYRKYLAELEPANARLTLVSSRRNQRDYILATDSLRILRNASEEDSRFYYPIYDYVPTGEENISTLEKVGTQLKSGYVSKRNNWNSVVSEVNEKVDGANNEINRITGLLEREEKRYRDSLRSIKNDIALVRDTVQKELKVEEGIYKDKIAAFVKTTQPKNDSIPSFFRQMNALSNLGYDINSKGEISRNSIWWAKWFIVLLFFIVEISPVFVKLIAPPGSYDDAYEKKRTTDQQIFRDNMDAKIQMARYYRENWIEDQKIEYEHRKNA